MSIEIRVQKAGRPAGRATRNPSTVRLALNSMGFDVVKELVKAIQAMDDIPLKVKALENLMRYLHPMIKEVSLTPSEIIELENMDIAAMKPADIPTEELLDQVKPKEIE